MSEKERKDILKTISEALPKMSDFDKGYFLGVAESKAAERREAETDKFLQPKIPEKEVG